MGMASCAHPRAVRTTACVWRAAARLIPGAANGRSGLRTLRAGAVRAVERGTSWDVLSPAHCAYSVLLLIGWRFGLRAVMTLGRASPNTGANQRGRSALSSSAGNGGVPRRLAITDAMEALLDSDGRPRYQAMERRAVLCRAERSDHGRSVSAAAASAALFRFGECFRM